MAVENEHQPVTNFDQWYKSNDISTRTGLYDGFAVEGCASSLLRRFEHSKREMDARCHGFENLEKLADNQVVSEKPDLPNVSSGETSGLIRRIARNLVQHVPNVEISCEFDDDSPKGVLARHILLANIIGSDSYSNDMQQNLFASTKAALTVGFDAVVPVLKQLADRSWIIEYDTIHYRDVFPEPGAKDVRKATEVFVRRYLTKGEVHQLIRDNVAGWDPVALKTMVARQPSAPPRQAMSASQQDAKKGLIAEGYEVITWYSSTGAPFLTFCPRTSLLLRIEKNKHPLKWHPVFFLVPEKDNQHPLGKSQVELLYGRQEFQDLMLNGAMKMWYRNINPPLLGYGAINAVPNLSPGKYTPISNPNAKIEPFEVSTQTLLQYTSIAQGNLGSMVNLVGSADQQMAVQAGSGMSATPQGVDAQQQMVDITTNNYQKAIEQFFSHYCSYALTIYFAELKGLKKMTPSAETRRKLIGTKIDPELFDGEGSLKIDMNEMNTVYHVRCVPGSLVELEDEKQLRILNQLFIPLSQAMPALASMQDQTVLQNAAAALQFIIGREIELSGFHRADDLKQVFTTGKTAEMDQNEAEALALEESINGTLAETMETQIQTASILAGLQEQISLLSENQRLILEKLGAPNEPSAPTANSSENGSVPANEPAGMVRTARA